MKKNDIEIPLIDLRNRSHHSEGDPPPSHIIDGFTSPLANLNAASDKFQKVDSHLKYYTYTDVLPLLKKINSSQTQITASDLPAPYETFNMKEKAHLIDEEWQKQIKNNKTPSFITAALKAHWNDLLKPIALTLFLANTYMLSSFLLGKIMNMITLSNLGIQTPKEDAIFYAVAFAVVYVFFRMLDHWSSYLSVCLGGSVRLSITGFMYHKLNKVALSSLQEINVGKVINILSNDVSDLEGGCGFLGPLFLFPYNLVLSCFLMWTYFELYSLISILIVVGILILTNKLSNLSKEPRMEKNLITDQRIRLTNEFIENIRLIKLYAWEKPLMSVINKLREKECEALKKLGKIDSIGKAFGETCSCIAILFMCIAYSLKGKVLSPEKVYTSFMILSFVKHWVVFCFRAGTMYLVSARLTCKRLEDILFVKDIPQSRTPYQVFIPLDQGKSQITFKDFTAYWSSKATTPCLKNLNLTIPSGKLIALIGKIGSGKTTFLLSFLREIPVTSGHLTFTGSISYVEQEPVIFAGSLRENILFGHEYDDTLYRKVLRASNLNEDLKQFDFRDQTLIGERGVTLSGGQKARLSLARALYAQSDIYLLDDPLSAVDSRVGRIIFERAIKGFLKDKTVILVTHHLNYAKEADKVIMMDGGKIEAEGKFKDLLNMELDLLEVFAQGKEGQSQSLENLESSNRSSSYQAKSSIWGKKSSGYKSLEESLSLNEIEQPAVQEESTTVSKQTYFTYIKQSNSPKTAFLLLALFASSQALIIAFSKYLGYWAQLQYEANFLAEKANSSSTFSHAPHILVCILLLIVTFIIIFIQSQTLINFLLEIHSNLHEKLLMKISRTFVSFFDATPLGAIINRFSNDLGTLDRMNWGIIYDVVNLGLMFLIYLAYLCYINLKLVFLAFIVLYSLYRVQVYFKKPSIELKKIELMSRSPIYSEISSTINGLLIIRVYHQGQRFINNFMNIIYKNSQAFLTMTRTTRLFAVILQLILYLLCVLGIALFIYIAFYTGIEAGLFGLALYYLTAFGGDIIWAIRQTILLDINMQSAERLHQYCLLEEEAPLHLRQSNMKLVNLVDSGLWPQEGYINFNNVYLRYENTENYALNGLTFEIKARSKVAVVGRTGAGKSSIIQALFRIVEIEEIPGSSIVIDGVNIKTLGLETLRKSLSILPQTPVIFTGTIRRNLDPFEQFSTAELWSALEQVSLKSYVETLEKGLDTDMSISSSVFSSGQKQLVCMARVILKKSKVVILDEATANVDMSTDSFIQEKINQIFKDCVVITIAHRLSTIAHYDKVLVLDQGRMVESAHPYELLVKKIGDNEITKRDGLFAEMVKKNGDKVAKEILKIARKTYFVNKEEEES